MFLLLMEALYKYSVMIARLMPPADPTICIGMMRNIISTHENVTLVGSVHGGLRVPR